MTAIDYFEREVGSEFKRKNLTLNQLTNHNTQSKYLKTESSKDARS